MHTKVFACDCNGSAIIDLDNLKKQLTQSKQDVSIEPATQLCRRQSLNFAKACEGTDDVLVNCTQEKALFEEIASAKSTIAPIRYINTRELALWGKPSSDQDAKNRQAKAAALFELGLHAPAEPVASVSYASRGRLAILGSAEQILPWAARLKASLQVTGLVVGESHGKGSLVGAARDIALISADAVTVAGWLGSFTLGWQTSTPIDMDACVRCGACQQACPEQAISSWLEVDMSRCKSHRSCVDACGSIGAIDFSRVGQTHTEEFDLVLDLRASAAFAQHQKPQGYFHRASSGSSSPSSQSSFMQGSEHSDDIGLAISLSQFVGEFEKPKFFAYKAASCAHSRNEIVGCKQCIDVCSAKAISSAGDKIQVNPHLCVGCGACSTVCPSGAIRFAFPSVTHVLSQWRNTLRAYQQSGGQGAHLLIADQEKGLSHIVTLPGHVIAVGVHHVASLGIEAWFSALAYGASKVSVLLDGSQAPEYEQALRGQARTANTICEALGLGSQRVGIVHLNDLPALGKTSSDLKVNPWPAATFQASTEKRRVFTMALDHLLTHTEIKTSTAIALEKGAPFGSIQVDAQKCTMCLACVSSCTQSALMDNQEVPQLRLVEHNCVQCGLCETTCPEQAITLIPQLNLSPEARQPRVLNEAKPFHCIRCQKAFGTAAMVESMLSRLSGHSLFAGVASERLKMCADCRVIDMMQNQHEASILDQPVAGLSQFNLPKGKP